jgi:hypothetical protein
VTYDIVAERLAQQPAFGRPLGTGRMPGCGTDPATTLDVYALEGVEPEVAVGAEDGEGQRSVWLAPGYVIESPQHPLHEAVYGSAGEPDADAGFDCEGPRSLAADALNTPRIAEPLQVKAADAEIDRYLQARGVLGTLSFDARSAISGAEKGGIPFIEDGSQLALVVRRCRGTAESGEWQGEHRLVVDRLSTRRVP